MSPDELYTRLYAALCGPPQDPRPWHFQWHGVFLLRRELSRTLSGLGGDVLDLGCGSKPYQKFFGAGVNSYVGADVAPGPAVDIQLTPGEALPFPNASFDTVLCTQVLEHIRGIDALWQEITRVLRPGGHLVLTVPFLFHLHGEPHDYRRFTKFGLQEMLRRDFHIQSMTLIGGIGSSITVNLLCWVYYQANASKLGRYLFAIALPAWVAICLGTNLLGLGLDLLDSTGRFAHDLFILARKANDTEGYHV